MKLTDHKDYIRFWVASTTSDFGTYITTLALQVLVVVNLNGNTVDVGWINSSRWLPYVLLGLVAGVLLDRVSRRPVLVMTLSGIGAVIGTTFSTRAAQRFGIGRSMAFSRILYCPAGILMVLAPSADHGVLLTVTLLMIGFGQFLYGFALGIEGPLEMGYQQSITPARLQGRMNATKRSINRSMIVIGAPLGGIIADVFGFRTALWVAIVGLAVVGVWFTLSPMRDAQIDENVSS